MKHIGKNIRHTASKIGAGLGFNTRAHRVGELKRTADTLKKTHSPKGAVIHAIDIHENMDANSTHSLKMLPKLARSANQAVNAVSMDKTKYAKVLAETNAMSEAAKRELARRRRKHFTVGAGIGAGVGTAVAAEASLLDATIKRKKKSDKSWEKAAKNVK